MPSSHIIDFNEPIPLDPAWFAAAGGQDMRISSFGIDASDGVTTMAVRGYCYRNRFSNVVFALKGASQPNKPVIGRPTYVDLTYDGRPIKGGVQLWPIGTDIAKSTIYHRLALDKHVRDICIFTMPCPAITMSS